MKIAFVCQPWDRMDPPVETGSVTLWTYEMARRLATSAQVVVYARRFADQRKVESVEGVEYRRISAAVDLLKSCRNLLRRYKHSAAKLRQAAFPTDRPLFASSLYYWTYIARIARDLRAQGCDVVHIHNYSQFPGVIKSFNPGLHTVLHMHCEWLRQLDPAMVKRRLRKANLVLGCSDYIAGQCRTAFPDFAACCKSLPNGVDSGHFSPGEWRQRKSNNASKRLLFVGRISPEKGLHVLLDAFRLVVSRYPEAHLQIIGPDSVVPKDFLVDLSDDPIIKQLALFYGNKSYRAQLLDMLPPSIAGRVSFIPFVPHSDLIRHYRLADVFVFPSVCHEAFGMPVIEAMAAGVPVVATRAGGVIELVDHRKTGFLVDRGDASGLAEAILLLLEDPGTRESMGQAARQRAVSLFSWESIVDRLRVIYRSIGESSENSKTPSAATV